MKVKLFKTILTITITVFIVIVGYLFLTGKTKQAKNNAVKIATENVFCGKNYTAEILKINDVDIIKRIIEIWGEKEGKCELNFGGKNLGIAKKVSSDGKIYHIVIYDKDDNEQSRYPFDQSLEQFEININDNTVSYLLPLDGSFFEIGKLNKFTNGSILSLDDFKKIRDFADANDISKNPNRDLAIVSGFEVETYGNYKPFDNVSIRGILNGNYREYIISEDFGSLYFSVLDDNNYENMSNDDVLNAQKMTKLVLNGINSQNLLAIDKWQTHKSDYGLEFKYPQGHTPLRDEEADNLNLILVPANIGERNIKIAISPNDPSPSGKFFQTEMPYMRLKIIKGIYGSENWLSTRKNEYFPDERDIKNQRKIDIDGKEAIELIGQGNLGALYRVVIIQGKENLIAITQDIQTDMFDQILSTFKFTE